MTKQPKYLRNMVPELKEKYGEEKARTILNHAQSRYEALIEENKDDPPAYSGQKRERIYPCIACSMPWWMRERGARKPLRL